MHMPFSFPSKLYKRMAVSFLALGGILILCLPGCAGSKGREAYDDTKGGEKQAVLSYDSFDGGGPEFTVLVDDPSVASYTGARVYKKADHAQLDGAGYTEVFTFTGLAAGQTTVTVQARSPIGDNYDAVYALTVDDTLRVSIEAVSRTDADESPDVAEEEPIP